MSISNTYKYSWCVLLVVPGFDDVRLVFGRLAREQVAQQRDVLAAALADVHSVVQIAQTQVQLISLSK